MEEQFDKSLTKIRALSPFSALKLRIAIRRINFRRNVPVDKRNAETRRLPFAPSGDPLRCVIECFSTGFKPAGRTDLEVYVPVPNFQLPRNQVLNCGSAQRPRFFGRALRGSSTTAKSIWRLNRSIRLTNTRNSSPAANLFRVRRPIRRR